MSIHSSLLRNLVVVFSLWLSMQTGGYLLLGPQTGGDSPLYEENARNILKGEEVQGRAALSKSYLWFLAATFRLGGDYRTIVFLQTLMALGAAMLLFLAGIKLGGDSGGFLASLLYLINIDIQVWNFYLLPETFTTFLLITLVCLTIFYREQAGWAAVMIPCALLFVFSRPETKYLLLPFILVWFGVGRWDSFVLSAASLILFCLASISPEPRFASIATHDLSNGIIVWGYNNIRVSPPEDLAQMAAGQGYLAFLLDCLVKHPSWVLKVLAYRALYFITHYRPYYSLLHNTVALIGTFTIYLLAIVGTLIGNCTWKIAALIWSLFLMYVTACVSVTLDWDCRFEARAVSILSLLAALGAGALWGGIKRQIFLGTATRLSVLRAKAPETTRYFYTG